MQNLRINEERLWDSLMEMAKHGATARGGSCRLALSDEDQAGRNLFIEWCKSSACDITVDTMGNIFARRASRKPSLPPMTAGSHLDTQPHGGKFDGVYGVLAALEVVRTLNDHDVETEAPIEVAVWTNEEGSRFPPPLMGSSVFVGTLNETAAQRCRDRDGKSVGEELKRIGYAGEQKCGVHPIGTFFEAHIEQGPILEAENKVVGVVSAVQGVAWYEVTVSGQDAHAGSTPMNQRRDALVGAAQMIDAVRNLAAARPDGRATVGKLVVSPNSPNTIPGRVDFNIDIRDPSAEVMKAMEASVRERFDAIADRLQLEVRIERVAFTPPVVFDADCVAAVERASRALGYPHREMLSGAGHDACCLARVAPTSMIFVPCAAGLSHNEEESATPADLAAGCNVLLHAMLSRAGV